MTLRFHPSSKNIVQLCLIILVLAAIACSIPGLPIGNTPPDLSSLPPTAPQIVAQRPFPGEEMPLDGSLDIYFDQPMDHASVESALHITPAVTYDLEWVDDSTLRLTPRAGQLERASQYSITIDAAAKSAAGLALPDSVVLDLETVGYLQVSEVVPDPGGGAVDPESVILVTFNRPVVPLGISGDTASLPQPLTFEPAVPGKGEWINTSIYRWTPSSTMIGSQDYTVSVDPALTDQTGGVMESPFSWQFTTLPPGILGVSPADATITVGLDTSVSVEFNQPMDRASVESAFSLVDAARSDQPVRGTFKWDAAGKTMTFIPKGKLALDGQFRASLTTGARSAGGQAQLAEAYSWRFDTVHTPAVAYTAPASDAANVPSYQGMAITFTAPMNLKTLDESKLVSVPPLPDNTTFFYSDYDWTWYINAVFEPSTNYAVTLQPGVSDLYGNTITKPYTFSFSTGPLDPMVQFNTVGSYGLYDANRSTELFVLHRNVSRIDFTLARLTVDEFGFLSNPNNYEAMNSFRPTDEQTARQWSLPALAALNETRYVRVPISSDQGGALEPGIYMLIADAPEVDGTLRHFMIVVNANVTFKSSFDESLAWITDLNTGSPLSGVTVTFLDHNFGVVASGVTNSSGVVEVSKPHLSDLWTLEYALVQQGDVFALAMSDWGEGVQSWDFNLPSNFFFQDTSIYLYSDRPLYRPGQDVYFKGIVRSKNDVTYSLPRGSSVQVQIYNEQGDVIYDQSLQVNEMGTFSGSLRLDENAGLGYYSVQAMLNDTGIASMGFQVAQYRKPEFLVNLTPASEAVLRGETIKVEVDSQFFFGGPVSNAEVQWSALADDYYFQYEGAGQYSFIDYTDVTSRFSNPDYIPGFGETIAEGQGKTDSNGKFTITLPASLEDAAGSRRLTIEATVTDVAGQPVSGRAEVVIHQGQVYVGVNPEAYVAAAGSQQVANLVAVGWDSQPVAGQVVNVQLLEQVWNNVQEQDEFGRTQWTWSVEERKVGDPIIARTDDQGRARVTFVPPRGGTYKILATVTDSKGNTVRGSAFQWVSGTEYVVWPQANNNRIDLVSDRRSYKPGDTAEILITSPFQGSGTQALITVERGSILDQVVIPLNSNSTVYRLPITGSLAPNVFVSVVVVKGVDDTNPVPSFRIGMVELQVEPSEQTVGLEVTPDQSEVGPGDDVTYTIKANDFSGKPVDAEVSLALVDLATLSLAAPNSIDVVEYYYGLQGLGVKTSMPMIYLVDMLTQELLDQGKGGGGGGGEGFFDVRTRFEDTAYWTAHLRTGEDGQETVTVTLPDNLTTWRLDARAVTAGTLVGQTQVDIVATKPLLVRPNTPRFFVATDEATLSAVVNNNTDQDMDVKVKLEANGVSIVGSAEQSVRVAAHGRSDVNWPVVVDSHAEWVDLTFSAVGGDLSDASKPTLGDPDHGQQIPVLNYSVPDIVGTAGQLTQAESRLEGLMLPPNYEVQDARVDIRIDPSLAASTLDSLTWLEHYPYECTEQTVSRFLPNAITMTVLEQFNLSNDALRQNLDTQLGIGLQRLYSQQHADGGWGWTVQDESNPMVSAYVIQGMLAAREAGKTVSDQAMNDGLSYLTNSLQSLDTLDQQYLLHRQMVVLFVLAKAGQPDVSRTVQMFDAKAGMQHWAQALLAQTLWMIDPADTRIETIKSDLTNTAILSSTGTHWEEETQDAWNWNTDTRSTAIILSTYAKLWPDSDLAPNIVRWLMVARAGGHWETTQETVWAIIGLTDWMKATGELTPSYDWRFLLNGKEITAGTASPENVLQSTAITLNMDAIVPDQVNRLGFSRGAGEGRMYYSAHLTSYLPVPDVTALSRGVMVSRRYLDASGKPVTQARVGDTLTAEVTIIAPHDLYYMVVEDPYPAGAEAVDTNLLTESVTGERPQLSVADPLANGWGWWWFSSTQLRDQKAVLMADYLPAGTYQYTYQIRLGIVGKFRVIPTTAWQFYMPEVYGRGDGMLFTILP